MRDPEPLGFHGIVLRSTNPVETAARWGRITGLPVRSRSRNHVLLGRGPELFVCVRRARRGEADSIEELHLAVKDVSAFAGKPLRADPLGGDGFSEDLGPLCLIVREFRRAPAPRWRVPHRKRTRP